MDGIVQNYLHHAPDSSFPSDHATLLFALGWSLFTVRPTILRLIWIVPMILALAVGWSRVFLGAHYPLDVVGAAVIGLAASCFASLVGYRASAALTSYGERIYEWPLSVFRRDR
jgi:undecaprenyl-diphosphatase